MNQPDTVNDNRFIRLLQDSPLDGPTNMARDETLLIGVESGETPPTLRLYQWSTPTISLGYFQHYSDVQNLDATLQPLPVVRRLTGGGAILHDLELTYSLTLSIRHPLAVGNPNDLYEAMHKVIIACLKELDIHASSCGASDDSGAARGPFFCFARRHRCDVLIDSAKIAGSAQRRCKSTVLQHGSIILANRFDQQPTASVPAPFEQSINFMRNRLPSEFSKITQCPLEESNWMPEELQNTGELIDKYSGGEWTKRC